VRKGFEAVKILNLAFFALVFSVTYRREKLFFSIFSHLLRLSEGFPLTNLLGSAGRLNLPAEPRGRREAVSAGKPEAFRTAGGRAAFSATLTRPWVQLIQCCVVASNLLWFARISVFA
jgi:hypothetical protein